MNHTEFYNFICASQPMAFIDREAELALEEVFKACPQGRTLLSEKAMADLRRSYRARVETLYVQPVAVATMKEARYIDPAGALGPLDTDISLLLKASEKVMHSFGSEGAAALRDRFPLLTELEAPVRRNYIDSQAEFFNNFLSLRGEISAKLLGGRPVSLVKSILGDGGDLHRHGRAVCGVETDAGTFYYKPHDCSLDVLYHELIAMFFSDFTMAAECVRGKGCGFVSELKAAPLEDEGQLHDYFRNLGMLGAVLAGIGAGDMHSENILPCGLKPSAIDLETMFHVHSRRSTMRYGAAGKRRRLAGVEEISNSIARTGIMPSYTKTVGMLSPLFNNGKDWGHLPEAGGRRHTAAGYENDFRQGFQDCYGRLLEYRGEIKSLFGAFSGAEIRYLPRNTAYYSHMLYELRKPDALRSREGQQAALRRLRVPYEKAHVEVDERVIEYEASCLLEGDVPYFCTTLDSIDMCGRSTDEIIHKEYFLRSARSETFEMLDRLSASEARLEDDVIKAHFSMVPLAEDQLGDAVPAASAPAGTEDVIRLAGSMDAKLRAQSIHSSDGLLFWQVMTPWLQNRRTCGAATSLADAALFEAKYCMLQGRSPAEETLIKKCIDGLLAQLGLWQDEDEAYLRAHQPLSYACGLGGLITATDELGRLGCGGAEELFHGLLGLILKNELYKTTAKDRLPELAGLLLAVCESSSGGADRLALIRSAAESLLERIPQAEAPIPEFLAGAGAAMALASSQTGDLRFAQTSEGLFGKLMEGYKEKLNGWPEAGVRPIWLAGRGRQAPWIGLCALNAQSALAEGSPKDIAGRLLELALSSVLGEGHLWYEDSLYHGNALTVRFLTRAAKAQGRPELHERAGCILGAMMQRAEKNGAFNTSPKGLRSFFDSSHAFGAAGIGCAAIEWLTDR